jgi:hypothetical protein
MRSAPGTPAARCSISITAPRLDQLEAALAALGKRLVLEIRDAT